ncbi:carbon storage regulator [Pseudomonas saudiphocaensis]|uniref:carbon storage regulator n=1 Tax=Pseudomonas saudiphocaensis TaxID=1499686 RepID=UPI00163B34EA|nr:carbon storage regulator [Pseudomonas saudiphocaensis]
MGLVLTRRRGEEIKLTLSPDYTLDDLYDLITKGIVLTVTNTEPRVVKLAFNGPRSILIVRTELLETSEPQTSTS